MLASQIPAFFLVPFAADATPGTTIRTIPLTTSTPGAASFEVGFPSITFTPIPSGGLAPDGRDFNGILNASTSWDQWFQVGGPVGWNSALSAAIGGYPRGALISSATFGNWWLSSVDNNTSDPDTGGADWVGVTIPTLPSSSSTSAYSLPSPQSLSNGVQTQVNITGASPSWGTFASNTLTINESGIYAVVANLVSTVTISSSGSWGTDVIININGNQAAVAGDIQFQNATTQEAAVSATSIQYIAAGQTVKIYASIGNASSSLLSGIQATSCSVSVTQIR